VTTVPPHCLFCETTVGPFDIEDVLPKWLRKVLPPGFSTVLIEHQGTGKPKRWGSVRAVIKNGICKPCNGGWMRRLEDASRPILRDMINPRVARPVRLDVLKQTLVAFWCLEKALCLEIAARQASPRHTWGYLPSGQFPWIYDHREREQRIPSPGTQVWLFAFMPQEQGEPLARMASQQSVSLGPPDGIYGDNGDIDGVEGTQADDSVATLATFTIGALGFQVFAHDVGERKPAVPLVPPEWLKPVLVPVWPPTYPEARWLATGPSGVVRRGNLLDVVTWGGLFRPADPPTP
jgi:hypothetical protein